MARFMRHLSDEVNGKLIIEEQHPNYVDVFYVPPEEKLAIAGLDHSDAEKYKTLILGISGQDDFIEIFPINTNPQKDDFLKPKYAQLVSIVLEGFDFGEAPETQDDVIEILESLPSGFIKDYDYGLGLLQDFRFIIHEVENIANIKQLVISKKSETSISENEDYITIKYSHYNEIRKGLNSITRRARSAASHIKPTATYNYLSYFLDDPAYPQKDIRHKSDILHKLIIKDSNDEDLSESDQKEAIELVTKNTKIISNEQPESLVKLRNDIELVTLEKLIEKYEGMILKNLKENRWQNLFSENPFILALAFGYPIIKVQDHASIGGKKICGGGDKITDFLVKNNITNNAAIFEIKTPQTKLLNNTKYRENVYVPSSGFSGAINQLLDQQHKFQKEIATIKENTRISDLETYSVHGVLIIGKTPDDLEQQKSFELFRGNSKEIVIITFDELLEKLRQLHSFLS